MEIDFSTLFTNGDSSLEIYLCPMTMQTDTKLADYEDVDVGWTVQAPAHQNMRYGATANLQDFYYKDLVCTYDKSNDSQKVVRKILTQNARIGNLFMAVFKEDQVPAYMFPTTQDIAHTTAITRKSARINNRLFIIHDKDATHNYYYLKYQHSDNVDVTKMKSDLNSAIEKLYSIMNA